MSRRVSNHHNSRYAEIKKLCKVCKDTGKSKLEYETHTPKNERGIVCCPIIKAHLCKKCRQSGHFEGYCMVKEKDSNLVVDTMSYGNKFNEQKKEPEQKKKTLAGMFDALKSDDESSDDEVVAAVPQESVLKKPKVTFKMKDWDGNDIEDEVVIIKVPTVTPFKRKSWADTDSDSDSDSDSEDTVVHNAINSKITPFKRKSWADTDSDEEHIPPNITLRKHQRNW